MLDKIAHFTKEIFDSLNSKGGGIFMALVIFYSAFWMWWFSRVDVFLHIADIAAGTIIGLCGGERLANGKGKEVSNVDLSAKDRPAV